MSTRLWANTCLDFPVKRVKYIMSPYLFLRRSTRTKTPVWQVKFPGENNTYISWLWLQERLLSAAPSAQGENRLLLFWRENVMMKYDAFSSSLHIWLLKLHVISKLLLVDVKGHEQSTWGRCQGNGNTFFSLESWGGFTHSLTKGFPTTGLSMPWKNS